MPTHGDTHTKVLKSYSGSVSFEIIFEALKSDPFRFTFHLLNSKILKIPGFNLIMGRVSIFVATQGSTNRFRMIRNTKRGRMIPMLPWFQLYFEKWPKIIFRTPNGENNFFSSQIQDKLETLYVSPRSRFFTPKFQKISITRGRKKNFRVRFKTTLRHPMHPQSLDS